MTKTTIRKDAPSAANDAVLNGKTVIEAKSEKLTLDTLRTELFNRTDAKGIGPSNAEVGRLIAMLTTEPADDSGSADVVYALYPDRFLYCEHIGWLTWKRNHWEHEGAAHELDKTVERVLRYRCIAAAAKPDVNTSFIAAVKPTHRKVKDCVGRLMNRYHEYINEFDSDPDLLNVDNGVLHLPTGELRPHGRGQRFTYCLKAPYNPQADVREVVGFLLSAVEGGEDAIEALLTFLGYCLTGRTSLEKLAFITGKPRAGKGTLTEAVKHLMGKLAEARDFSTFTARRDGDSQNFDMAGLKACRVVFSDESNKHQQLNAQKIKSVTGGSDISCAFKGRDFFSYRPQFKIVLTSNFEPNIDVDDDAAWNRLVCFSFPNAHDEDADGGLKERMKQPCNQEALLALMAEGAKRFYALKGRQIPLPNSVKDLKTAHRDRLDTVAMWLAENMQTDAGAFIANEVMYANYKSWCESNGVTPKLQRGLGDALKAKGFQVSEKQWVKELQRDVRGVRGLRIKGTDTDTTRR